MKNLQNESTCWQSLRHAWRHATSLCTREAWVCADLLGTTKLARTKKAPLCKGGCRVATEGLYNQRYEVSAKWRYLLTIPPSCLTACHLPLHKGGLGLCRPVRYYWNSTNKKAPLTESHQQKRLPCAKGAVNEVDWGIVLFIIFSFNMFLKNYIYVCWKRPVVLNCQILYRFYYIFI